MKTVHMTLAMVLPVALLTACGGGGSDSGTGVSEEQPDRTLDSITTLTVDASDYNEYAYLNLITGQTLSLTDTQAAASTDWHVAFRRSQIKLNGGTSGPGSVAGAVVADQADFYDSNGDPDDSVFLNATADSELEHLDATYAAPGSLETDALVTQLEGSAAVSGTSMDMGWYWYNFVTHQLSLNDGNGWLLRSGEGDSYARFRATAFQYDSVDGLQVTFSFDVQSQGSGTFDSSAEFDAAIGTAGGEACFDFDTDSAVACSGTAWDLKVVSASRSIYLVSNGGISGEGGGAAFGPHEWVDNLEDYTSATSSPDGTGIAFLYAEDSSSGIFDSESWYAYNLTGYHKLHPNYRVYWVDTDADDADAPKVQLQVVNYYSDAGASGHVSVRWKGVE